MRVSKIKSILASNATVLVETANIGYEKVEGVPQLSLTFDLFTRVYGSNANYYLELDTILRGCSQLQNQAILEQVEFSHLVEADLKITQVAATGKTVFLSRSAERDDNVEEVSFTKAADVDITFKRNPQVERVTIETEFDLGRPIENEVTFLCTVDVEDCTIRPFMNQGTSEGRTQRGSTTMERAAIRIQGRIVLIPKELA